MRFWLLRLRKKHINTKLYFIDTARFHQHHRKHVRLSDFFGRVCERASQFQSHSHQWSSSEPLLSHGPTPSLPLFTSLNPSLWVPVSPFLFFFFFIIISLFLSFAHTMHSCVFWWLRQVRLGGSVFGVALIKPRRYAVRILGFHVTKTKKYCTMLFCLSLVPWRYHLRFTGCCRQIRWLYQWPELRVL